MARVVAHHSLIALGRSAWVRLQQESWHLAPGEFFIDLHLHSFSGPDHPASEDYLLAQRDAVAGLVATTTTPLDGALGQGCYVGP